VKSVPVIGVPHVLTMAKPAGGKSRGVSKSMIAARGGADP